MTPRGCAAAALAAALLALGAGEAPAAEEHRETVKFQDYPGLGNLMIRVARSKGWCASAGLECELVQLPTVPQGLQSLVGGSIDVAMADTGLAAIASSRGASIKMISGAYVAGAALLVVRSDLPMPGEAKGYPAFMADLQGRKFGVPALGSTAQWLVQYLFREARVAPGDISFAAVGAPRTAFAALTGGRVDALVTYEPTGALCEISKQCKVLWRQAFAAEPAPLRTMYGAFTGLVMRASQVESRPALARSIVKLARQAEAFINDPANTAEVLRISNEYSRLDSPEAPDLSRRLLERGLAARGYRAIVKRSAVEATLGFVQQTETTTLPTVAELVWSEAPDE